MNFVFAERWLIAQNHSVKIALGLVFQVTGNK
jgi:hypothetical protein